VSLLNPCMYRLSQEQEDFLAEEAERQGHGNRSLVLRVMIDRAIREKQRRKKTAA